MRKQRTYEHKQDAAQLNEMYQTMTLKEVGEKIGISRERVRQILKRAGYPTNLHCSQIDKDKAIQEIITYRQAGKTYREISALVGLSPSHCFHILKINGAAMKYQKKQPGCPDCLTKPYALGYCNKCYMRFKRQNGRAK